MEPLSIDLNCDMGELPDGGNDSAIMPYISSANIACGGHAGDHESMQRTVALALRHRVAIGAHPSFPDREGFGRRDLQMSASEVRAFVFDQICALDAVVKQQGGGKQQRRRLHHVKPHGALYNLAAKDAELAQAIAAAVREYDSGLILYGLSGSLLISEAKALGLRTASEVFADRSYERDGSLTPRSESGAMIESLPDSLAQVLQMIHQGCVMARDGSNLPIKAETICIHGDEPHAPAFARAIADALKAEGLTIRPPV
jgi:5-oxoprolinase (ATP-hydrolysing) subunit A